jgi:hypothetical protein
MTLQIESHRLSTKPLPEHFENGVLTICEEFDTTVVGHFGQHLVEIFNWNHFQDLLATESHRRNSCKNRDFSAGKSS